MVFILAHCFVIRKALLDTTEHNGIKDKSLIKKQRKKKTG